MSKSCQKVVKKLSKSCQKVVIKSCPHRPNTENLKEEATKNEMKNEERVVASSTKRRNDQERDEEPRNDEERTKNWT
jgi:hypothetical protein